MARFDGKLTAAGDATIDAAELLAALGAQAAISPSVRKEAIIRYLSASEGWRDAGGLLGGAFADEANMVRVEVRKLSPGKEG
ncbi:MAG TPA: hypothetical protein VFZ35_03555 [Sphingomicrobium sp.]